MGVMCLNLNFVCVIVLIYSFTLVSLGRGGGIFLASFLPMSVKSSLLDSAIFHLVINFLAV